MIKEWVELNSALEQDKIWPEATVEEREILVGLMLLEIPKKDSGCTAENCLRYGLDNCSFLITHLSNYSGKR